MNDQGKYFSIIFSLVVLYLSFLLIKPFLGPLISAVIISYIFYPLFKKINNIVKNKNLSILLMVLLVTMIILIPTVLIAYTLIDDIAGLLNFIKNFNINSIPYMTPEIAPLIRDYLLKILEILVSGIFQTLKNFVFELPDKLISMIVFLFAVSMFLKDGPDFIKKFKITVPLEKIQKDALFKEFESVTKGIIYSVFLSAIINGIVGGLVFYLFDIPNPLLWGFVMTLLSLIPIIGHGPILAGGVIYLILSGKYLLGLLFVLLVVLITHLDNLVIMKIVGKKTEINPFLVLMGLISGLKIFGLIGLILGPLILSLLITMIRFYTKNYKEKFNF